MLEQQIQGLQIAINEKNSTEWKLKEAEDQINKLRNENYQLNEIIRKKQEEI